MFCWIYGRQVLHVKEAYRTFIIKTYKMKKRYDVHVGYICNLNIMNVKTLNCSIRLTEV